MIDGVRHVTPVSAGWSHGNGRTSPWFATSRLPRGAFGSSPPWQPGRQEGGTYARCESATHRGPGGVASPGALAGCASRRTEPSGAGDTLATAHPPAGDPGFPAAVSNAQNAGHPGDSPDLDVEHPRVQTLVADYQTTMRPTLERALQRGSKYLPGMKNTLKRGGRPARVRVRRADRRERLQPAGDLARRRRRPLAVHSRHRPALRPPHRRLRRRAARPREGHPRRRPLPARPVRPLRRLAPGAGRLQHRRGQHRAHPRHRRAARTSGRCATAASCRPKPRSTCPR